MLAMDSRSHLLLEEKVSYIEHRLQLWREKYIGDDEDLSYS